MKRKRIAGRKGRVKNNNLILKKQLQNTNIISIRKVYLMVWCIELNWKSDQLRIKKSMYQIIASLAAKKCAEKELFFCRDCLNI